MQKNLLFQSFLDLFLAVLIGNLLILPFLIFAIYHLPASNEIRIGVLEFPDNDDLVWKWYRDKSIEPVEIIREDSILKITYKAKLSDGWEVPDSIELENMGYAFSGQYVFDKNPYSDIISKINKDKPVASILEPLAADLGRLFIILIVASQLGFLIIGWWRRRRISGDDTFLQRKKTSAAKAVLLGLLTGILLFGTGIIYDLVIKNLFGFSADTLGIWDAVKKLSAFEKITIILLGSLFAPFCEELFFRGVIFERFLQAGLPIFGLIFSSVIFASIHLDFTNIIVYLLFGLILAFLYWKTKSLAASIVAHGINNALAFIFLIFL